MKKSKFKRKNSMHLTSDIRVPVSSIGHPTSVNDFHGITLIALIVTIIVILILVAVTVRIVVNSGLFGHAGNASSGYDMEQAREKLDSTLANGLVEKYINPNYNENDYLDNLILANLPDAKISENIVMLDGWAFEIDRSVPTIAQNLGKEGNFTFPSIISITKNLSAENETATITIVAEETKNGINKIEVLLDGEVVESFDCKGTKTQVTKTTKDLIENGKYVIKIYSELSITEAIEITELVAVTHLDVSSENSSDNKKATITITAKEAKNGIQKIVITKDGATVTEIDCNNTKEQITRALDVTENGTYTVIVYAENNKTENITISGLPELTLDRSILQIGNYINYTPDTSSATYSLTTAVSGYNTDQSIPKDSTLKWQVMNINEDGSVDIVSTNPTDSSVGFGGALGYNNGVYVLNDLCNKLYSNTNLEAKARSINLQDIEPKFNSKGIAARNSFAYDSIKFGKTYTYSGSKSYAPNIYAHIEKTTVGDSENYYESPTTEGSSQKGTLTVTQTYYYFTNTPSSYIDDQDFYKLIFNTGTKYCLATRYGACVISQAGFGLRYVDGTQLNGSPLLVSTRNANSRYYRVRPVVHLGANIKISTDGGTVDSPREISL